MPLPLLAWSLTIAALIHIFEEFVFPGGFKEWWLSYRPDIRASVSNRFPVIINVALVLFSANVALAAQARRGNGVAAWLALTHSSGWAAEVLSARDACQPTTSARSRDGNCVPCAVGPISTRPPSQAGRP